MMAYGSGSATMASFLSSLTFRRSSQIASMDPNSPRPDDPLLLFHHRVADHLLPSGAPSEKPEEDQRADVYLTIPFLVHLLEAVLLCDGDFLRLLADFPNPCAALLQDILLKSLDVLNAASASLDSLRSSLSVAASAVPSQPHRALSRLIASRSARSFSITPRAGPSPAQKLQAMAAGLQPPRRDDPAAMAAYAMGSMVVLAMWALLAALPGGGGREEVRFSAAPRQLPWAAAAAGAAERIGKEWKSKDRKGTQEMKRMENLRKFLTGEGDGGSAVKVAAKLVEVSGELEEQVGRLQVLVREVYHSLARTRMEIMAIRVDQA